MQVWTYGAKVKGTVGEIVGLMKRCVFSACLTECRFGPMQRGLKECNSWVD